MLTDGGRESDAIIAYLLEKYDPEYRLSFEKLEDRMEQLQWLFFQAAGQGSVRNRPLHRDML